jgi:hypothetical protein
MVEHKLVTFFVTRLASEIAPETAAPQLVTGPTGRPIDLFVFCPAGDDWCIDLNVGRLDCRIWFS